MILAFDILFTFLWSVGEKLTAKILTLKLQRLSSTWSELGKLFEADPLVTVGKLDCTQSESICHDNEVRGYPTLQYFRDGERVAVFRGNRVLPDLRDFVLEHKPKLEPLTAPEVEKPQDFEEKIARGFTLVSFLNDNDAKMGKLMDNLETQFAQIPEVKVLKVDCGTESLKGPCENEEV